MNTMLITVGIIAATVLAVIIALHIHAYAWLWLDGNRLRRKLAAKGRCLSLAEAQQLIEQGTGTILVDAPSLGWNVSRVWWSPENIAVNRPESWDSDRMCPAEDHKNYDNLIDDSAGTAKLIAPFVFTQRLRTFLRRHFGLSDCLFVSTGGVLFERAAADREAEHRGAGNR